MNLDGLKSIADVDVSGKRVLIRTDLNVPMQGGAISDATRLERVVPGIRALLDKGAKVIVLSHFGRPKGSVKPELSLRPVAEAMAGLIGKPVAFAGDGTSDAAAGMAAALNPGDVMMVENLRFNPGEEANDKDFAAALAKLGELYVGDAFSCSHRAHASTEAITHLLPSYAGALMMEEVNALRSALDNPKRPVAAVVGGAKVSTKIPVLTSMVAKVDRLIIGGGMANTFLQAQGRNVGTSLSEPDFKDTVLEIIAAAKAADCEIVLPVDAVVAREFKAGAANEVVAVDGVPNDAMILDVGPKSVAHLSEVLAGCKTLLWNGPLGAFEIAPFGDGTFALAREAAAMTGAGKLMSVAGGGDTVAALNAAGVTGEFSYVSSAGGAFLEWLEGRELPGVAALAAAGLRQV